MRVPAWVRRLRLRADRADPPPERCAECGAEIYPGWRVPASGGDPYCSQLCFHDAAEKRGW